jgi:hypothetical protein
MAKFLISVAVGTLVVASPAFAHHTDYLGIPYPTRGDCEAQRAALSNDDDWLLDAFPQLFSSEGEVRSFLNRAFTCELNASDGQNYITDHRVEVLGSEWFQRRNH